MGLTFGSFMPYLCDFEFASFDPWGSIVCSSENGTSIRGIFGWTWLESLSVYRERVLFSFLLLLLNEKKKPPLLTRYACSYVLTPLRWELPCFIVFLPARTAVSMYPKLHKSSPKPPSFFSMTFFSNLCPI